MSRLFPFSQPASPSLLLLPLFSYTGTFANNFLAARKDEGGGDLHLHHVSCCSVSAAGQKEGETRQRAFLLQRRETQKHEQVTHEKQIFLRQVKKSPIDAMFDFFSNFAILLYRR